MIPTEKIWLVIRRSDLNNGIFYQQKIEYLFLSVRYPTFFFNISLLDKSPLASFEATTNNIYENVTFFRKSHLL